MDKLNHYRSLIKQILTDFAELGNRQPTSGVDAFCVFDEERDVYLYLSTGWTRKRRQRGMTLFVRIRDGKIWIEEDWTEEGITKDLLAAGVPKADIVLAFQPPEMRHLTEFAVA